MLQESHDVGTQCFLGAAPLAHHVNKLCQFFVRMLVQQFVQVIHRGTGQLRPLALFPASRKQERFEVQTLGGKQVITQDHWPGQFQSVPILDPEFPGQHGYRLDV